MSGDGIAALRTGLLRLRVGAAGWGYRAGTAAGAEPTALAALGLLAADDDATTRATARAAADWLAGLQRPDGSVGPSADRPGPGWATSHALLLWAALGGYAAPRGRATDWLLGHRGNVVADTGGVGGHDGAIVGWPWVDETHSWLEPTAWSVLALHRQGRSAHPRARDGRRLIRDRAIAAGGWNYGNRAVFGRDLRPLTDTTGLALLALATGREEGPSPIVERAIGYLLEVLPTVHAAASLGWGLLGLRAWGRRPAAADAWLDDAADSVLRRPGSAPRLALLLLAAGDRSLEVFGLDRRTVIATGRPDGRGSHHEH